jgi:hypothetical protein
VKLIPFAQVDSAGRRHATPRVVYINPASVSMLEGAKGPNGEYTVAFVNGIPVTLGGTAEENSARLHPPAVETAHYLPPVYPHEGKPTASLNTVIQANRAYEIESNALSETKARLVECREALREACDDLEATKARLHPHHPSVELKADVDVYRKRGRLL